MKFFHYFYRINLIVIIFCISVITCSSAQRIDSKLKLAKALEKNYEYESALRLYRELYETNESDFTIIEGIRTCLSGLQDYTNLIDFLTTVTNKFPHRLSYQVDLAEAHFLNNDKEQSNIIWNNVINKNYSNVTVYRQVAASMISLRLYDEAINVYKQALARMKDQSNLHIEIANIYRVQLAYDNATHHYLQYFQLNPKQKSFVQREILKLTDSREHISQIIDEIRRYLKKNDGPNEIKEILAGLYIKERRFTEAFNLYKDLENSTNTGIYLQKFAIEAFQNRAYNFAIDAYILINQLFPGSPQSSAAQFQIAVCQSLLAFYDREAGSEATAAKLMAQAQKGFTELIQTASVPAFAADSYIKLGDIALDFYFDLDQAEANYQKYVQNPKGSVPKEEVVLKLADVYLMKNNLHKAHTLCAGIRHKSYQIESEFKKVTITYYQGDFSKAQTGYNNLLGKIGTKHTLTNDILARLKIIQKFLNDSVSLTQYASAELLTFQKKQTESVKLLVDLYNKEVEISPRAGRDAVHVLFSLKKYRDARALLLSHMDTYPDDTFNDEILFYLAQCEELLGNINTAVTRYKELLIKFPNSLYTFDAREHARKLTTKINSKQT